MSGSWYDGDNWHFFTGVTGSNPPHNYNHYYGTPIEIQRISDREFCEYCHGYTKMDDRGNCVACGAPKPYYPLGLLMR